MSIDKHISPSYNEYKICKFHTLPKCTITTEGGMILLQKSEKGQNLTLFRKIDQDSPLWTTLGWFILYSGFRQANEKMKIDN